MAERDKRPLTLAQKLSRAREMGEYTKKELKFAKAIWEGFCLDEVYLRVNPNDVDVEEIWNCAKIHILLDRIKEPRL